jgi:hypothetical protein
MKAASAKVTLGSELKRFVIHTIFATLGAQLFAILLVGAFSLVTASVTRNTSGGNFIDHMADQPSAHLLDQPYFVGPVIVGLVMGFLLHIWFQSRLGAWVWTFPALILIWNLFTWEPGPSRAYWPDVWESYFSGQCGSSECLYEQFVTCPFYTSVAYALGWLARIVFLKTAHRVESGTALPLT